MAIRPLNFKVVIKKIEQENKTDSGIILQENDVEPQHHAIVEAVGPGYPKDDGSHTPLSVKPGDKVVYRPGFMGVGIDDERMIIDESGILGILPVGEDDEDKATGDQP